MSVNTPYIVSARKYRPATFESVVGQRHITSTLQNAISSNQLAQAFLFCGPRGVGKTTCARILAKTINCTNRTSEVEACNECESCTSFNKNASLNIIELDAASNNSVDDIRELVQQINVPPMNGKYKVYIIDEVHMLSTAAFNAFLKTLEEPPKFVKFILATTEKHKILPTILSRCQIFDFHRITIKDISDHLEYICNKENVSFEKSALDVIAEKADGGLRDALSMFDLMVSFTSSNLTYQSVIESLNILDYDYFFRFVDNMLATDISSTLILFDEVLSKGFQGDIFIDGLSKHLRNLLISKDTQTIHLLNVPDNAKQRYFEQCQKCQMLFLLRALDFANTSAMEYRTANNKRLCVELMLMKMCNIMNKIAPKNPPQTQISQPQEPTAEKKNSITEPNATADNTKNAVETITPATFQTPYGININNATRIQKESEKPEKSVTFSMDEVRKSIKVFVEDIRKKIQDNSPIMSEIDTTLQEDENIEYPSISMEQQLQNQKLIDVEIALSKAEIKPYNNEEFLAQIFVETQERKDIIDSIRKDLTQFIIKRTHYPHMKLDVIALNPEERQSIPTTPVERFTFLMRESPAINLLKENFKCEIKY